MTRSRRQRLVVWTERSEHEEGICKEALALELDRWQVPAGRARERPARSSAWVHMVFGHPVVVQLLPCYDPWSDEACDDYLRKRVVHELHGASCVRLDDQGDIVVRKLVVQDVQ